jgi:hypothetical protein
MAKGRVSIYDLTIRPHAARSGVYLVGPLYSDRRRAFVPQGVASVVSFESLDLASSGWQTELGDKENDTKGMGAMLPWQK